MVSCICTVNHNRFLEYTKDDADNFVIYQKEAVIIKRIYREYFEGASCRDIGNGLMVDGILTGAGRDKWIPSTIYKILSNEKYIGDALLQKTVTTDFLEKKREINNGLAPQYYVEGSHDAVIPRDLYMRVQEEMVRRANLRSGEDGKKKHITVASMLFQASVLVRNVVMFIAESHGTTGGKHSAVWKCCMRVEHGPEGCDAPTIRENDLQVAVMRAINKELLRNYF